MASIKKNKIAGLTDHLVTIAEQIDPAEFFSSSTKAQFCSLLDALIRHFTGVRPVKGKPLVCGLSQEQLIEKVVDALFAIWKGLKWNLARVGPQAEKILLHALGTAWVIYRYTGKLPKGLPKNFQE